MAHGVGKRLSKTERQDVLARYQGGESSPKIALALGVSDVAIRATLRRLGAVVRDKHACHRKYQCDPTVLTHTTAEGAYWLGFFAADGYVSDAGRMEFCLATADSDAVVAFRDFLRSEHPVRHKAASSGFAIRHPDIIKALAAYGIGPRKSLTLKVAPQLAASAHFWRGMLDGDGCLTARSNCPQISLVGSEQSTLQFKEFCSTLCPGAEFYHKPHPSSNIWYVRVHGDNARTVASYVYGPVGPALSRKQRVARSWSTDAWLEDALAVSDDLRQEAKVLLTQDPPYRVYRGDEIATDFTALWRYEPVDDSHIRFSTIGRKVADSHQQRARWNTSHPFSPSPSDRWRDEAYLLRGLTRLRRRGVERDNASLRRWLLADGATAAQFPPTAAKAVYSLTKATAVLDPCAGWGDRLCAALACDSIRSYIGLDTNPEVHPGYASLLAYAGLDKHVTMLPTPFESYNPQAPVDLVFTSPPYFNLELYAGRDPYPSLDAWTAHMAQLIRLAEKALRTGGHLAIALSPIELRRRAYDLPSIFSGLVRATGSFFALTPISFGTNFGDLKTEQIGLWRRI